VSLVKLILRVLRNIISPTRYTGTTNRLIFANYSYTTWTENIFVRNRSVIFCIFETKSVFFLFFFFGILDIVVVIRRGGPKLTRR
jgi:hypothetical protein